MFVSGYINSWFPDTRCTWTSVSLLVNIKSKLHNQVDSMNMSCAVGNFRGGELWLEATERCKRTSTLEGSSYWSTSPWPCAGHLHESGDV